MKRYAHQQTASYGLYLSLRPLDMRFVGADGESLDGREGASYRRIPTWLAVLAGPVLGGVFVLAFPLLVIGAILGTLGTAAWRAVTHRHAYVARSNWQPAASYFDASREPGRDDTAAPSELHDLEAEVAPKADAEKRDA